MAAATTPTSSLRFPAELALITVSLSVALGFGRLFSDGSFFGPLAIVILATHVVSLVARRQRLSLPLAASTATIVFVLLAAWVFYLETTRLGLPTSLTLSELRSDFIDAFTTFRQEKAPVEPLRGFVVASAAGFAFTSFLADWSAFRLWAPFEAILLSAGLFIFSSVLGAEQNQITLTVLFIVSILGFLLLHRVARQEVSARWVRGDSSSGVQALLRLGTGLAAMAVVGSVLAAPLIPGARDEALLDWRNGTGGSGSRVTISPLVEIQGRLLEQKNIEVFTVRTNDPQYWRLTSLDDYDGTSWSASRTYRQAGGSLDPGAVAGAAPTKTVAQEFTIQNLAQVWLPAAYKPTDVDVDNARWDGASGTLISESETSDGMIYEVTSEVADVDAALLMGSTGPAPIEIRRQYLALPATFSTALRNEALDITADLATPYEKARALQDHFRSGTYTYDLETPDRQSEDFLEDFVFDSRRGYCVQFTTAFAAMARSIGLPSRVAVGFTPGDLVPGEADLYQVRGRQAHSWPEVYFTGVGWIGFEPTPGRGAPGTIEYTGVAPQQDSVAQDDLDTTATTADPGVSPFADQTPNIEDAFPDLGLDETGTDFGGSADTGLGRTSQALLAIVALAVGYAVVVPISHRFRRERRRRAATSPSSKIDAAWVESTESLSYLGVAPDPAETPSEFADRAARRARLDRDEYAELAGLTSEARYSGTALASEKAQRADEIRTNVSQRVRSQITLPQQAWSLLDPRPLVGRRKLRLPRPRRNR